MKQSCTIQKKEGGDTNVIIFIVHDDEDYDMPDVHVHFRGEYVLPSKVPVIGEVDNVVAAVGSEPDGDSLFRGES